jgi:hypothetical protein
MQIVEQVFAFVAAETPTIVKFTALIAFLLLLG